MENVEQKKDEVRNGYCGQVNRRRIASPHATLRPDLGGEKVADETDDVPEGGERTVDDQRGRAVVLQELGPVVTDEYVG